MKHFVFLVVLLAGCATKPKYQSVVARYYGNTGTRLRYSESRSIRIPETVHAYKVGRLPSADDQSMTESGNWYHIEQSAYWNRFIPTSRIETTGPNGNTAARAYRPAPTSGEISELRNEALQDKQKLQDNLNQIQLAKEKLSAAMQNTEKTNQIISGAMSEISKLRNENEDLKRKLQSNSAVQPDADFQKFEKQNSKPQELAPGPNQ
jgi:hypothetical protein